MKLTFVQFFFPFFFFEEYLLYLTENDSQEFFRLDIFVQGVTIDLFNTLVRLLLHHPIEHFALV